MQQIDKSILAGTHLFKPLDDEQLQRILGDCRVVDLSDGEALFSQGDEADYFYLVLRGNIKLFRLSEGGNEKIIEIVRKGQVFAEAVMFFESRFYPVNAAALSDATVCRFSSKTYLALLSQSVELCFALFGDLSVRLHRLLNEVEQLSLQNGRLRVVQYLDHLRSLSGGTIVELDVEKKSIAARLSITPETLSRIFRELADRDIVSISGKIIEILDHERLLGYGHT